ncbi:uncharacterized protein DUF2867 [Pacificibacter maritimus]|uniref:Uncharacterized protein DUF2867 n=1 Tax=Pacificibacter maritimus TaxID=762213 RepID=A0A3N4UND2_9RHOB|nr:DUF2867 domain-containing protein [Pacificibacter maritimus]RPE71953.1 uncharacterized protein DUF2867 [Pacificibacter maritimus]
MPKVIKTPLPKSSQLWTMVHAGDFMDGYAVRCDLAASEAANIGLSMPVWADALLKVRNAIVKPFGLKTGMEDTSEGAIFPITHETEDEIILGTDDQHLNFRIAMKREGAMIHMATWVHRNNIFGRAYLAAVMPFHIMIVRDAMRRIARHNSDGPIASTAKAQ